jgi:hypothetical protein
MLFIYLKKENFDYAKEKILTDKKNKSLTEAFHSKEIRTKLLPIIKQSKILSQKYEIMVTNPPYMSSGGMNKKLSEYLKSNYKNTKKDLFSAFIEKSFSLTEETGQIGLLTPYVWMFIQSFQNIREEIIKNKTLTTLTQLEYNAFPEACVPVCIFTFKNKKEIYNGQYIKLSDFKGIDIQELKTLEAINNPRINFRFIIEQDKFSKIPGSPIAYWIGPELINAFKDGKPLGNISDVKVGLQTGDNNQFLRYWYEVNLNKIGFNMENFKYAKSSKYKWFPYNKGGSFRKWYGNQDYVINYENDGEELKNFKPSVLRNTSFYFKESLSWSKISSGNIAFRYFQNGFLFDVAGCSIFVDKDKYFILGLLNSKICSDILKCISPTLNYEVGHISSIPLIFPDHLNQIIELVKNNIFLAKNDWDYQETSWYFRNNPILAFKNNNVQTSYLKFENTNKEMFVQMKNNEIKLNNHLMEIYNYKDNSFEIEDKDISINLINLKEEIQNLISYFIGCLFGRYSLNEDGLIFAGGEFDFFKYTKPVKDKNNNFLIPDNDNIVPILDSEYFEDDIVKTFEKFLKLTFGEETLEENLLFIAKNLKSKGSTNREIIRNYFMNSFFNDHKKMYKKTPIYWLFDSGKDNGFKALVYMHRYSSDLVARIRTEYLHKTQKAIELAIESNENILQNSSNNREIANATKERNKLVKQLEETRIYDEALAHIANQQIVIDLDDGVKVNYAKFQNVEISSNGKIKKINLLKSLT